MKHETKSQLKTITTTQRITLLVKLLNSKVVGMGYDIDSAYGGVRLTANGGSRDVSTRLSRRELTDWMAAMIQGIDELEAYHAKVERETDALLAAAAAAGQKSIQVVCQNHIAGLEEVKPICNDLSGDNSVMTIKGGSQ